MFKVSSASDSTFLTLKQKEGAYILNQTTLLHSGLMINMISLDEYLEFAHYTSAALKLAIAWGNSEPDS